MTRIHQIALVASVATLLAAPAPAGAAEVSLVGDLLSYDGFDSEANSVVVTRTAPTVVAVSDAAGIVVSPGGGCTNPEADNTATCTGTVIGIDVDTRGGDDSIDLSDPGMGATTTLLNAGAGNDTVLGTSGRSEIRGGAGNDVLDGGTRDDEIIGGAGHDLASYESETRSVTVDMTPGSDNDGPAGDNDDVNVDGSVEGVIGGTAGDTLSGSESADEIHGNLGGDLIDGGPGPDELRGGPGEDSVDGAGGADQVSGDGGVNADPADPEDDVLLGGTELDLVQYAERVEFGVTVDLGNPDTDGGPGEDDELSEFEGVQGGAARDLLFGTDDADLLIGGSGDDRIDGRLGDDELVGNNGSDTASYAGRGVSVTADLRSTALTGGEAGETDTYAGIENLYGGDAADTLTGDTGANLIEGNHGDDVIAGFSGADELHGGDGADTIDGGNEGDSIYGDAGPDSADGGEGDDVLRMRDGEVDTVVCGIALDSAIVDVADTLADCESVDTGVPPEPVKQIVEVPVPGPPVPVPGPAAPAGPGAPAPVDDRKPAIQLGRLPSTMKLASFVKGVKVSAGCDEQCALDVELRGSARSVKLARSYDLTLGSKSLARAAGTRTVTLKPTKRLLGPARRLTVQLRITATDAAGNRSTKTKTMKIR